MNSEGSPPSTRKQLRQFGLLVGSVLILIGWWWWYRGSYETGRVVFWVIGGLLVASGLIVPAALKPIHAVWMKLAHALAWINTRIIISLVFFLIITPIGFLMRLMRRDILGEKFNSESRSYWTDYQPVTSVKDHCERQF